MSEESREVTIYDVLELVRFEFRRYGFRADGGKITRNTNGLHVEFCTEPATGQAAFTQDAVEPYFILWVSDLSMDLAAVIPPPDKVWVLDVGVSYTHFGDGRNGHSARYTIIQPPFGDPPILRRAAR
jgi:hypothetical protein